MRGAESEVAHKWSRWLHNRCYLGLPDRFRAGEESEVAHKWANRLDTPCRRGGSTSLERREESEVQVGHVVA